MELGHYSVVSKIVARLETGEGAVKVGGRGGPLRLCWLRTYHSIFAGLSFMFVRILMTLKRSSTIWRCLAIHKSNYCQPGKVRRV